MDEKKYAYVCAPAWQCGTCTDVHDDEIEALQCCQPDITEGFRCPFCQAFHREEKEANECCPENSVDTDSGMQTLLTMADRQRLESAGQMRLLP